MVAQSDKPRLLLRRIHIDNYKCMSNFTVKIRDFTLLMGKNGTGKSAIFEVINCLHRFICQKVDITHIFPTFTLSKFMTHSDQTFELEVSDDDGEFRYVYKLIIEHERAAEKARVKKEELLLNDQPILKIEMGEAHMFSEETPHHEYREGPTFPFNWSISGFTLEFKEEFNSSLLLFRKWAQGIVALSPNPWQIKPSSISESVFLDSHAENFASWYRNNLLTNYQNISEKVDTRIQQILPGYNGLHFHGTGGEWNRFCSWF
ncbi:MAG: AAA family ATPase [Salinispira sp.]